METCYSEGNLGCSMPVPILKKKRGARDNSRHARIDLELNQLLVVDNWKELNRLLEVTAGEAKSKSWWCFCCVFF